MLEYKREIESTGKRIARRAELIRRLEELEGKRGFGGERSSLRAAIKELTEKIEGSDTKLFKLEAAKPFRDVMQKYRKTVPGAANERTGIVTMSQGQYNAAVARIKNEKVYSRKDAEKLGEGLYDFDKISKKTQNRLFDKFWEELNAIQGPADKVRTVQMMADSILDAMATEIKVENPEYSNAKETISYIGDYVQRLTFSDDLKEEMLHKYDKDGIKSFMGRWGYKKSDGHSVAADEFVTNFARENVGYDYLEDMNSADALIEINDLYDRLKAIPEKIYAYEDITPEEHKELKSLITNRINEIINESGEKPYVAQELYDARKRAADAEVAKQKARARYRELYNEQIEYQKATLALDRVARGIRAMKQTSFDTSAMISDRSVMGLIKELAAFEYRYTFTPAHVREKTSSLLEWYRSEEAKRLTSFESADSPGTWSQKIEDDLIDLSSNKKAIMSAAELRQLAEVLQYFKNLAISYNKVFKNGKWVDAAELAQEYVKRLKESKERMRSGWLRELLNVYEDTFMDPLSVARRHDGYVEGGFFTDTFLSYRKSAVNFEVEKNRITEEYFKFFNENKNYERDIQTRFATVFGNTIPMAQAIELYMSLKQQHARRGFVIHGFKYRGFDGIEHVARPIIANSQIELKREMIARMISRDKNIALDEAREQVNGIDSETFTGIELDDDTLENMTKQYLKDVEEKLTDADRKIIEIIERGYNVSMRQLKYDTDMQRLGFSNVMSGYYYPISRGAFDKKVEDVGYHNELQSVSNISANKSREKWSERPLTIRSFMQTYTRHVNAICMYAAMQETIDTYNKVYNVSIDGIRFGENNVAEIASEVWGERRSGDKLKDPGANAYFKELAMDIQGLKQGKHSRANEIIGMLRGGVVSAGLGANSKVWLSQLSSYAAAGHVISNSSLTYGLKTVPYASKLLTKDGRAELEALGEIVDKYCPIAKVRNEDNHSYEAQGVIENKKSGELKSRGKLKDAFGTVKDISMLPIGKVDRAVVCMLFEACKKETATNGVKLGSEENLKLAGEKLTEVILDTQQNSIATEKSAAMRSDSELVKAITMFTSDSMRTVSRLIDRVGEKATLKQRLKESANARNAQRKLSAEEAEAIKKRIKQLNRQIGKSIGVISINSAYMAALSVLFAFLRGKMDDEYNVPVEFAREGFTALLGGLPLISDIVDLSTGGYELSHFAYDQINQFCSAVYSCFKTAGNIVEGKAGWGSAVGAFKKMVLALAQLTGLPVRNVYNQLYGIIKIVAPSIVDSWDRFLKS